MIQILTANQSPPNHKKFNNLIICTESLEHTHMGLAWFAWHTVHAMWWRHVWSGQWPLFHSCQTLALECQNLDTGCTRVPGFPKRPRCDQSRDWIYLPRLNSPHVIQGETVEIESVFLHKPQPENFTFQIRNVVETTFSCFSFVLLFRLVLKSQPYKREVWVSNLKKVIPV